MAGPNKNKTKPDLGTFSGVILAGIGIVGGLILEGGELRDIVQITAAIIVLCGTFGAVLLGLVIVVGILAILTLLGRRRQAKAAASRAAG